MGARIIGVLIGIAIMFGLEWGLDANWYVSLPLGAIGYFTARYIGYFITERKRFKREMKEVLERARSSPTAN
jgi:hypothetical protein